MSTQGKPLRKIVTLFVAILLVVSAANPFMAIADDQPSPTTDFVTETAASATGQEGLTDSLDSITPADPAAENPTVSESDIANVVPASAGAVDTPDVVGLPQELVAPGTTDAVQQDANLVAPAEKVPEQSNASKEEATIYSSKSVELLPEEPEAAEVLDSTPALFRGPLGFSLPVNQANNGAITGVEVTKNDVPVSDPNVALKSGDIVSVKYTWKLPESANVGDYIEIALPDILSIGNNVTGDVEDAEGNILGTYIVNQANKTLRIDFLDEIFEASDINGTATVTTKIKFELREEEVNRVVEFPISDTENISITFEFQKVAVTPSIQKYGVFLDSLGASVTAEDAKDGIGNTPTQIRWTIYANLEQEELTNAYILDSLMPTGSQTYLPDGSGSYHIQVERINVLPGKLPGDVIAAVPFAASGNAAEDGSWTLEGPYYANATNGDYVKINLTSGGNKTSSAYRITFISEIFQKLPINSNYQNIASLFAGGKLQSKSTCDLGAVDFKGNLKKSGVLTKVDYGQNYIDWTIIVNLRHQNLAQNTVLTDTIFAAYGLADPGHEFTAATLANSTIQKYNGISGVGGNLIDSLFGATLTSSTKLEWKYTGIDTTDAFIIKTRSYVTNPSYYDKGNVGYFNRVEWGSDYDIAQVKSATSNITNTLDKTVSATDQNIKDKQVNWVITLKPYRTAIKTNDLVTDTYRVGDMRLIDATFVIVPVTANVEGTALTGADYTLTKTVVSGKETGFTIKFLKDLPQQEYRIKYSTNYDVLYETDGSLIYDRLTNRATWSGINKDASYTIPYYARGAAAKVGSYDSTTGLITWMLLVNSRSENLGPNVLVKDTLGPDQTITGAINVFKVTMSGGNPVLPGTPINTGYQVTNLGASGFYINFDTVGISDTYLVVYTARPTNVTTTTFHNTMELNGASYKAVVTRGVSGTSISKKGTQVANSTDVNWVLTVNKGKNNIKNAEVIDTMSYGQTLVAGSLKIYNATLHAAPPASSTDYLVEGTDYDLLVEGPDPSGSGRGSRFTVTFKGTYATITDTFAILCTSHVDQDTVFFDQNLIPIVNNQASLSGVGFDSTTTTIIENVSMNITVADASGSLKTGHAVFVKEDAEDPTILLDGAVFRLYSLVRGVEKDLGTATTVAGKLTFSKLKYGNYQLVEEVAPNGYRLTGGIAANTYLFSIGAENSTAETAYQLRIPNQKETFTIHIFKIDGDTKLALKGATFEIRQAGGVVQTVITGSDGKAESQPLLPGVYQVVEMIAPDGYQLDSTVRTIQLNANTVDQEFAYTLQLENDPLYRLKIYKSDLSDGDLLTGAEFMVSGNGITPFTITTGADGTAMTPPLRYGTYTLQETKAPAGYRLPPTDYTFTLDANRVNGSVVYEVYIHNQKTERPTSRTYTLLLQKVDADNSTILLEGAEFSITNTAGVVVDTLRTGADGRASTSLDDGIYYVRETLAPAGYVLDTTPRTIEISDQLTSSVYEIRWTNTKDPGRYVGEYRPSRPDRSRGGATLDTPVQDYLASDPVAAVMEPTTTAKKNPFTAVVEQFTQEFSALTESAQQNPEWFLLLLVLPIAIFWKRRKQLKK